MFYLKFVCIKWKIYCTQHTEEVDAATPDGRFCPADAGINSTFTMDS